MNGMAVLLKSMGVDVEDIMTHARDIGQAFAEIKAGQARCESLLLMICDRIGIERPISQEELDIAQRETALLLEQQAGSGFDTPSGTNGSNPLPSDRPMRVAGGAA